MKIIKYILISLGGIAIICIALIAVVMAIFDDNDYRKFAAWAVNHSTGYEMIIEGPFAVDISMVPMVSASKIRFESPPGETPFPIAHIGKIDLKFELLPLITGTVVIKELSVDDVSISWIVDEAKEDEGDVSREEFAAGDIDIPILEYVSLQNMSINLFDTNLESLGTIKLRRFSIDDIGDVGPLFVSGEGSINTHNFLISGRLGAVVNALNRSAPYPLEVQFESENLNLDISGEVDDFIDGEGLDINISGDVAEISNLLQLFNVECPELGHMKFMANISGNIEAPSASNMSVIVSDGDNIELEFKGSVNDLASVKGLDIGIISSITNNQIIQELLPGILSDITKLNIEGNLRDHKGDYVLEEITAEASNNQGLNLTASGLLNFGSLVNDSPLKAIDLRLRANTETTEAAKRFLIDGLPEMGPVIGTARLAGPVDNLSLEDLDIVIGEGLPLRASSKGRIEWIPIDDNTISGIDLNLSVKAEQTQLLASAFDMQVPELGAVSIDARLYYSDDQLKFEKIDARTANSTGLKIGLAGDVDLNFGDALKSPGDVNLELTVTAPNQGASERLVGMRIAPDMGPLHGKAQISGTPHMISLENIELTVGSPSSGLVKWHGRVGKIPLGSDQPISGLEIIGSLSAEETSAFISHLGVTIPDLGPLKGSWRLVNLEGGVDVEDIEFHIGQKETLSIMCKGKIKSLSRHGQISFAGFDIDLNAEAPGMTTIPLLDDVDLPDLGPLQVKAKMVGRAETLDIKNLLIRTGGEEASFNLEGEILTLESLDKVLINAKFDTRTQLWAEKYMQESEIEDHKLLGELKLIRLPDSYQIENFKLKTEGKKPLFLDLNGKLKKKEDFFKCDVALTAGAEDLSILESIIGISLPAFRSFSVNGRFKGDEQKSVFEGETHFGKTHFKTTISYSETSRHRPVISIKNKTQNVYLSDLGIYPKDSVEAPAKTKKSRFSLGRLFRKDPAEEPVRKKKTKSKSDRVFSEKPLPLDTLKTFDLYLNLDADKLVGKNTVINDLDFDLALENGRFNISPAKLGYAEGAISIESTLDITGEKPDFKLKATAEDVDMDTLLAHINQPIIIGGNLNLAVDLHSSGNSLRELASSLNGEIGYAIENGRIKRDVEMLTADAADVLTGLAKTKKYQDLNCMAIRFIFEDGIGTNEIMFLDTPNVRTRGKGKIDLNSETLDILLQPKPKKGLPGLSSAVRIKGSLSNPSIMKMPFKEAARLYGEIFAPYAFLPARGLGYLWYLMKSDKGEESPCLEFAPMDEEKPVISDP